MKMSPRLLEYFTVALADEEVALEFQALIESMSAGSLVIDENTGTIDFQNAAAIRLGAPLVPTDAATKGYVDEAIAESGGGGGAPTGTANTIPNFDANGDLESNRIQFTQTNSISFGTVLNEGLMSPTVASLVFGYNDGGTISTFNRGNLAFGQAFSGGSIIAGGSGASNRSPGLAFGLVNGEDSQILANRAGTHAHGLVQGGGRVSAQANGAHAHGEAQSGGRVQANGQGSSAGGVALGEGAEVNISGQGSLGGGVSEAGSYIQNTGNASFLLGYARNGGSFNNSGQSSMMFGVADADQMDSQARVALTFGRGLINRSYGSLLMGQFAPQNGIEVNEWLGSDPLITLGNGADDATRSIAFQIDKDGRMFTNGSLVNLAHRIVQSDYTMASRSDQTLLLDSEFSGTITVPQEPVNGLTITIAVVGAGAGEWTLTSSGAGFDPSVTAGLSASGARSVTLMYSNAFSTWVQIMGQSAGGGGGGANLDLSNLTDPTALNTSLTPATSNSVSLGQPSLRWDALYADAISDTSGSQGGPNQVLTAGASSGGELEWRTIATGKWSRYLYTTADFAGTAERQGPLLQPGQFIERVVHRINVQATSSNRPELNPHMSLQIDGQEIQQMDMSVNAQTAVLNNNTPPMPPILPTQAQVSFRFESTDMDASGVDFETGEIEIWVLISDSLLLDLPVEPVV